MSRTIAIGDVHGCADEFEALLDKLKIKAKDQVIQVGDLVNRGPDSHRTIKIARKFKVQAIIGNHELRLLNARKNKKGVILKDYDHSTYKQLTTSDWKFLKKMPKYIYLQNIDTVFVHGGFLPNIPWNKQTSQTITNVQVIDKKGVAVKRSEASITTDWIDLWSGSPFVIYGHTPRKNVLKRKGTIGIDTGCIYGGRLSAYIIEDHSLVDVPARKKYV